MHFIEYTHISLDKCKEKAQKTCSKNFHSPLILQMQGPPSLYHHNCSMALTHDTRHNKLNNLGKCDFWRIKPQSVLKEKKINVFFYIFSITSFVSSRPLWLEKEIKTIEINPPCFSQLCQAQWNAFLSLLSTWFHPLLKIIWT